MPSTNFLGEISINHNTGPRPVIGERGITREMLIAALDDDTFWFERFADADGREWTWSTIQSPPRDAVPAWAVIRLHRPTRETLFAPARKLQS